MTQLTKKNFLRLCGVIIFIILFWTKVDLHTTLSVVATTNIKLYALAFGVMLFGKLISTIRWKLLLQKAGIDLPLSRLFMLHVHGTLLNFTLPTTIGGDIYRVARVEQESKKQRGLRTNIVTATLLERAAGLYALMSLSLVGLLQTTLIDKHVILAIFIGIIGVALLPFVALCWPAAHTKIEQLTKILHFESGFHRIFNLLNLVRQDRKLLIKIYLLSLGYQLIGVLNQYLLFKSVSVSVPFTLLLFAVPVTRILTALPLTIGGIGLNEFSLKTLLANAGIGANEVAAYAVVFYSLNILLAFMTLLQTFFSKNSSEPIKVLKRESINRKSSFIGRIARGEETLATLLLRPITFLLYPYGKSYDVLKDDWDVLIVLDACRYDTFKKWNTIPGKLKRIFSKGTHTVEWSRQNFRGRDCSDIVYISACPQVSTVKIEESWPNGVPFHKLVDVWLTEWDEKLRTVTPPNVTARLLEEMRDPENNGKRFIAHYFQPHMPYIGKKTMPFPGGLSQSAWWRQVHNKGELEELKEAYEANLEFILKYIEELITKIPPEKKIVITADHGEVFGEYGVFGHPPLMYLPSLIDVPHLVVKR